MITGWQISAVCRRLYEPEHRDARNSSGGIAPFAPNAQFIDKDGLYLFKNIPGRLAQFTDMVANYLNLQTLPNKDKKIAIYYYKGPARMP